MTRTRDWRLGFVFVLVECYPRVVGLGMGAAKAVGFRKKFTAVATTGARAGTEDEAKAEDERSCCPLSAADIGTSSSSSPSSLRKGGRHFN
jgi:hypothetical protein